MQSPDQDFRQVDLRFFPPRTKTKTYIQFQVHGTERLDDRNQTRSQLIRGRRGSREQGPESGLDPRRGQDIRGEKPGCEMVRPTCSMMSAPVLIAQLQLGPIDQDSTPISNGVGR